MRVRLMLWVQDGVHVPTEDVIDGFAHLIGECQLIHDALTNNDRNAID